MGSPTNCRYSKEHEWARLDGSSVICGITEYAEHSLGDVVFVDLPQVGTEVKAGSSFATIESVKAVSDIYAPVDGKIAEVNAALSSNPELVNQDPYGKAWMIKITPSNAQVQLAALLDATAYDAYLAEISK